MGLVDAVKKSRRTRRVTGLGNVIEDTEYLQVQEYNIRSGQINSIK